ncbi:hypothetical protein RFI_18898, partial [Reticulomyxa filosa]
LIKAKSLLTNETEQVTIENLLTSSICFYLQNKRRDYKQQLRQMKKQDQRPMDSSAALTEEYDDVNVNLDISECSENIANVLHYSWIHSIGTNKMFEACQFLENVSTAKELPPVADICVSNEYVAPSQEFTRQVFIDNMLSTYTHICIHLNLYIYIYISNAINHFMCSSFLISCQVYLSLAKLSLWASHPSPDDNIRSQVFLFVCLLFNKRKIFKKTRGNEDQIKHK